MNVNRAQSYYFQSFGVALAKGDGGQDPYCQQIVNLT
jgi:hypothetical protein